MRNRWTKTDPAELRAAGRDLERWRSRRRRGTRIPERLWERAVEIAGEHGLNKTARALGLEYYALKARIDATGGSGRVSTKGECPDTKFVEIPIVTAPAKTRCVVEVEDGSGRRMRVELDGVGAGELEAVVRSAWGAGR